MTRNAPVFKISDLPDHCEGEIRFHIPAKLRRGRHGKKDERKSINSALEDLKTIGSVTGRADWSYLDVLDFGCGSKFTQALIQYEVNVQAYVGMDVFINLIRYLNDNIELPNFHFYSVPFRNEMYNPNGIEMTSSSELPGSIKEYDLITLQSVFTHFCPTDFLALLHVLRRYAASDGRMYFTCFIDNDMEEDFFDSVPDRPLLKAFYKEHFIRIMLEESNWKPISLSPQRNTEKHQFVCEPC
jgi:SAM-dependent methyltransferase